LIAAAAAADEDDGEAVDETGVEAKDIELVMTQVGNFNKREQGCQLWQWQNRACIIAGSLFLFWASLICVIMD
jgi:hypothetical protein